MGPGIQVGLDLVKTLVDVPITLRGRGGRGHGHTGGHRGLRGLGGRLRLLGGHGTRGGRHSAGLLLGLPWGENKRDLLDQTQGITLLCILILLRVLLLLKILLAEVGQCWSEVGCGDVDPRCCWLSREGSQLKCCCCWGGGCCCCGWRRCCWRHSRDCGNRIRRGRNCRQQELSWSLFLLLKRIKSILLRAIFTLQVMQNAVQCPLEWLINDSLDYSKYKAFIIILG